MVDHGGFRRDFMRASSSVHDRATDSVNASAPLTAGELKRDLLVVPPEMPRSPPAPAAANDHIACFYDWAYWLYPLVDCFCSSGRRRLIHRINQAPAGRLLEVGVGPGRHLCHYRGHEVVAIDCSPRMVASCRRQSSNADVRQMDGERLDFPAASFEYVVLCHVLSVTSNPARMLAEAHRVLRSRGQVFVLNHETPANAWRHVEWIFQPVARGLRFRSWFRLEEVPGVERFRKRKSLLGGVLGLMKAYSLEK